MKKLNRSQLRKLIFESINEQQGGEIPQAGDCTNIIAPWRNTGAHQITGAKVGKNRCTIKRQGFAGERYAIYSNKPFSVDGLNSSIAKCHTIKEPLYSMLEPNEEKKCHRLTVFFKRGDSQEFDLEAKSNNQVFAIEGV